MGYRVVMIKLAVLVVLVVACNKDKDKPAAGAGDCASVLDKVVDHLIKAGMTEGASESGPMSAEVKSEVDRMAKEMERMGKPIKAALTKACTDDKWPADVLACYKAATAAADFDACEAKLSPDQRAHSDKAVDEAMKNAAPKASPACAKYADMETECGTATKDDRPVIVDFCEKARAGAKEATYQLIALESACAETAKDCATYKQCIDDKKAAAP
jgi:hypothetical protein